MLKNKLPNREYKELTPEVIIRKSHSRINVMAIVANRLLAIKKRAKGITIQYPNEGAHLITKRHRYTKGGYALNLNGMPISKNGKTL